MTDTPETDAATYPEPITTIPVVGAYLARRLERERDAALTIISNLRNLVTTNAETKAELERRIIATLYP